jgi:putative pyruvate formate lyase activating enzyme
MMPSQCTLCPRECKIDRATKRGFCGAPKEAIVSKWMLHEWEEPAICYKKGSGAIFFSGCQLQCVFCQNHKISSTIRGKEMNADSLSDLFFHLEEIGACNINLISPTPHLETVIPALEKAKRNGLSIPVVFNSGGYEKKEIIKRLDGLIDIYLPDFKFWDPKLSKKYACAENYGKVLKDVIFEMQRQTEKPKWNENLLTSGVIVRHLVLPSCSADSVAIIQKLAEWFGKNGIVLSLMSQFIPAHKSMQYPELSRKLTTLEYNRAVGAAKKAAFQYLYTQKKESASEVFVPDFSKFSPEIN